MISQSPPKKLNIGVVKRKKDAKKRLFYQPNEYEITRISRNLPGWC